MGEPVLKTDTVTTPPTPFFPTHATNPTAQDVEQMINSRIHIAFDELQAAQRQQRKRQDIYKTGAIVLGTAVVSVGTTVLVGRLVRNRRARNASMK